MNYKIIIISLFFITSCATKMSQEQLKSCETKVGIIPKANESLFDKTCTLYKGRKPDVEINNHTIKFMVFLTPLFGPIMEAKLYAKPKLEKLCKEKGISSLEIYSLGQGKWYGWCAE